jgi:hypothetical protein
MDLPTFEEIFKGINLIFRLSGLPLDEPNIRLRFYLACLSLIITVVGEICFFSSRISPENILEVMDLAPCLCIGALSFFKGVFMAWKHKKICSLKKSLRTEYEIVSENKYKRNLMQKEIMTVNILIKYYFILNAALITVYNFSTLIFMAYHYAKYGTVKFLLPYAVIFPFAIDTWPVWTVCYIQSVISGKVVSLSYTS